MSILGTTLNNHGAATWAVSGGYSDTFSDGAVINNMAGATFTAVGSSGVFIQGNGKFNNAGTFSASTAVGGDVDMGLFFNTGTVVLQGGELELTGDGVTPSTGTFTAAAGTVLTLFDEVLTASSVICSSGSAALYGCTESGSFSAAGGTLASDSSFTGSVLELGSSLEVSDYFGGSVSFAPAEGGPVTLTLGTLTIDPNASSSSMTTLKRHR